MTEFEQELAPAMQGNPSVSPRFGWLWPIVMIVLTAILFAGYAMAAPSFIDVFQSFGADLPGLSEFTLNNHGYITRALRFAFAIQMALLVSCMAIETVKASLARKALLAAGCLNLAIGITLWVSFYLPLFRLGAVV